MTSTKGGAASSGLSTFLAIPRSLVYSWKLGAVGRGVWALQRALNQTGKLDEPLIEDGDFGAATKAGVWAFQRECMLYMDGIAGPATQKVLAWKLMGICGPIAPSGTILPNGLLASVIEGESANLVAAVNWLVAGGVDCGYTQRRAYADSYSDPWPLNAVFNDRDIELAFDSLHQIKLLRTRVAELHDIYMTRDPVKALGAGANERAFRLAVLAHNYPTAADKISKVGIDDLAASYWDTPAAWVVSVGAKFADGAPVQTPLEWCRFYSLGSALHQHRGVMVKYVESFTV